ncbi:MAG: phosphotransferase [Caldilineaceae bacterium]|nr:phosphotransferase [Caldilineaceae bacterium]
MYLNAIFKPSLDQLAFDPIRREFARSTVWWKRPLQRSYVALATHRPTATYLAQAQVQVSTAVPEDDCTLIVAGNHKLRLLNHRKRSVQNLLKVGFNDKFMRRELAVRPIAEACSVQMPALLEVNESEGWYAERYMSGTPTNRLANPQEAVAAVQQAHQMLQRLYNKTTETVTVATYVEQLQTALYRQITGHHLLTPSAQQTVQQICQGLIDQIMGGRPAARLPLETVLTHGDFQAANILVNSDGVWLIDWEYTARRQRQYDLFVFALNARAPHGLAARLQRFVQEGWPCESAEIDIQAQMSEQTQRQSHAGLFLLEELLLHLEENSQPQLTKIGAGLAQLQHECQLWLGTNE